MINFDCGIYTITSPSGKQYVGSATSFKRRWALHIRQLREGSHHCSALQRAFNKYGDGSFVFSKIAFCQKGDLLAREQEQLDARDRKSLYNSCLKAGSALGIKRSAETKAKLSEIASKRTWSAESRAKLSRAHKGRKCSSESKERMSVAQKGRTVSSEARAKLSAAHSGRKLTTDHRAAISQSGKGRKFSDDHKERISKSLTGKQRSQDHRNNISAALLGKLSIRSTSGFNGVTQDNRTGKWRAVITIERGKRKHIGTFNSPEAANEAAVKATEEIRANGIYIKEPS